jgi:hypothetical protein
MAQKLKNVTFCPQETTLRKAASKKKDKLD